MFQVKRELIGHTGFVRALEISNDGCIIVSASGKYRNPRENDMTARLWNANTGEV